MEYAKYIEWITGKSSSKEAEEAARSWGKSNPANAKDLQKVWELSSRYTPSFQPDAKNAFQQFKNKMEAEKKVKAKPKVRSLYIVRYAVAAMIVLGLIAGLRIFFDDAVTYYTYDQQVQSFLLPDGSEVVLNAKSSLSLDDDFIKGKSRVVHLEGEAFFNVEANPEDPFIIHTKNTKVEVVGTKFNLSAYSNADQTVVEVEEGIVNFEDAKAMLTLKANTMGVCVHGQGMKEEQTKLFEQPGWYFNRAFDFRNAPLKDIISTIEGKYQIKIDYDAEKLACSYSTSIGKDFKLDETLDILSNLIDGQLIEDKKNKKYKLNIASCN
ncbi:MAG: FecR domain-containing protein [Bacteroidota bacterium]